MDYSTFKGLFGLLIFGSVFALGVWQLISIKRIRRQDRAASEQQQDPPS